MFTYTVLALLFFTTLASAQTTTYFLYCTSNCSWIYPELWSNGVPQADSIVIINETACNGCNLQIDGDVTVAELHLISLAGDGADIQLNGKLTVTSKFYTGNPNDYNYCSRIYFYQDSQLAWATGSQVTLNYCDSDIFNLLDSTVTSATLVNNGTVTADTNQTWTGNVFVNVGDYYYDFILEVHNWGNWVADSGKIGFNFRDLGAFHHFNGWYNSSWVDPTTPAIQWSNSDLFIHSNSFYTDGPISHSSSSYNYYYSETSSRVYKLVFGAPDITLSWFQISGSNVYFEYSGIIDQSNFTYSTVNTTVDNTVTLTGETIFDSSAVFTALDGGSLTVVVDSAATLEADYIGLWGNTLFINNGTIQNSPNTWVYLSQDAWFVNTGLIHLVNEDLYYLKSSVPTGNPSIGKVVNKGTIQMTQNSRFGSYYPSSEEGDFYQCPSSWFKLGFGTPTVTDDFGSIAFAKASLSGYAGIYFATGYTYTTYESFFDYEESYYATNEGLFDSDLKITSTFQDLTDLIKIGSQKICIDSTYGNVRFYSIFKGSCDSQWSGSTNDPNDFDLGKNACSDLPDKVKNLVSSCPISANCGDLDTGVPEGESGDATGLQTSILLMLSTLVFLFFKF